MPDRAVQLTVHDTDFDPDGFLKDPYRWTQPLAQHIAEVDGLGRLMADHWRVIGTLRRHFLEEQDVPPEQRLCRESGLGDECIVDLFGPDDREIWRVAGLPNPRRLRTDDQS
jgi:sulfur relay (sulfurtransferase) DsrC/TusE family protein